MTANLEDIFSTLCSLQVFSRDLIVDLLFPEEKALLGLFNGFTDCLAGAHPTNSGHENFIIAGPWRVLLSVESKEVKTAIFVTKYVRVAI
jgi:hypothetical protein